MEHVFHCYCGEEYGQPGGHEWFSEDIDGVLGILGIFLWYKEQWDLMIHEELKTKKLRNR